jgi:hypothetical protein
VIVEYCRFGNLQTYLINHRNNFVNQVDELGNLLSDAEMQEMKSASIKRFCYSHIFTFRINNFVTLILLLEKSVQSMETR